MWIDIIFVSENEINIIVKFENKISIIVKFENKINIIVKSKIVLYRFQKNVPQVLQLTQHSFTTDEIKK
jgi:hypothetical protein